MKGRNHDHPCAINDTERVTKIYFNRRRIEKAGEGAEAMESTSFKEQPPEEENRADRGAA